MKKLSILAIITPLISSCSNVFDQNKFSDEYLTGNWLCLIQAPEIDMISLSKTTFSSNKEFKSKTSPTYIGALRYSATEKGHWKIKGKDLYINSALFNVEKQFNEKYEQAIKENPELIHLGESIYTHMKSEESEFSETIYKIENVTETSFQFSTTIDDIKVTAKCNRLSDNTNIDIIGKQ